MRIVAAALVAPAMAVWLPPSCSREDTAARKAGRDATQRTEERRVRAGDSAAAEVEALLRRMSLTDKVGQLLVPHVYGATATTASSKNLSRYGVHTPAEVVRKYRLGGVVYFPWAGNVHNPRQVAELSNGLQQAALRTPAKVPLLIGVDQENGVVARLSTITTQLPGNMAIGASMREADARMAAQLTGEELAALGIRHNYAPVADVNVNPRNPVIGVRSYGSDPSLVARMTASAVQGYHAAGVAATAKHFPGHGDTAVDSHARLPTISHSRAEWKRLDAPPFAAAIRHGVDAIMTGHVAMPAIDPSRRPATLSKPIITGLLRETLGYEGVVVTDGLDMPSVRGEHSDGEVAVRAVQAGADLLLMPPNLRAARNGLLRAVGAGRLSEDRIDASVRRVLLLKVIRGLPRQPYVDPGKAAAVLRSAAHLAAAQRIADHSVTVVRAGGVLPLRRGSVLVTGWTIGPLRSELARHGLRVSSYPTGTTPGREKITAATRQAGKVEVAVVTTRDANTAQQRLVSALARTGKPVVVVSVGGPYELSRLRSFRVGIATYSSSSPSLRAAAKVMTGTMRPTGRLPVKLPG